MTFKILAFFFQKTKDLIYLLLEREEERERTGRETVVSCLSHASQPCARPTTQAYALTGIEPATFHFAG